MCTWTWFLCLSTALHSGRNIRDVNPVDLRSQIAMSVQAPGMKIDSIRANSIYGSEKMFEVHITKLQNADECFSFVFCCVVFVCSGVVPVQSLYLGPSLMHAENKFKFILDQRPNRILLMLGSWTSRSMRHLRSWTLGICSVTQRLSQKVRSS